MATAMTILKDQFNEKTDEYNCAFSSKQNAEQRLISANKAFDEAKEALDSIEYLIELLAKENQK